jgi:uncharacterized membrane protein YkvA (DUF1232 family)
MSDHDPFPRAALARSARHGPAYARLAWRLARDPLLSKARRAAVIAAAAYLVSPIDAIPGVVPVLGQLDDLAVGLAALRIALDGLSPERRRAHLEAVGLDDDVLAGDLRTLGTTTGWLARAGGRTARRAGGTATRSAVAATATGVRLTSRSARTAARLAAGGIRRIRAPRD